MSTAATIDDTTVVRVALALAAELDEIRSACGEECANHVKKTLASSPSPRWEDTVEQAMNEWTRAHREILPSIVD